MKQPYYQRYVAELVEKQPLIASATSEVGIGGEMRTSKCAVIARRKRRLQARQGLLDHLVRRAGRRHLVPGAPRAGRRRPTIRSSSSCESPSARSRRRARGTRSACAARAARRSCWSREARSIRSSRRRSRTWPRETQVPFSHVLWSNVWLGIATSARRPRARVRAAAGARQAGHDAARRRSGSRRLRACCRRCARTCTTSRASASA